MNIEDLRSELEQRSHHAVRDSRPGRLAEVRQRVAARRRARATGIACAAAAVAAATVVPLVMGGDATSDRDTAPTKAPSSGSFPQSIDGNPLAEAYLAEPGVGVIERQVTLDVLDVTYRPLCRQADPDGTGSNLGLGAETSINGRLVALTGCRPDNTARSSDPTSLSVATLRRAGVRPGVPFTIALDVFNADADEVQRLGFALYEMTAPTVRSDGVTIPVLQGDGADQDRLVDYATAPVLETRVLRWAVPEADIARSVRFGWEAIGGEDGGGTVRLRVDGEIEGPLLVDPGTSYVEAVLDPGEPHDLELRVSGSSDLGTLLLAVYAPDA